MKTCSGGEKEGERGEGGKGGEREGNKTNGVSIKEEREWKVRKGGEVAKEKEKSLISR